MSCVAIHQKLDDFHCPRLVSSHITAYHCHRLVRRYAPREAQLRSSKQLQCSCIVHRRLQVETDELLLPPKIDIKMTSPLLWISVYSGKLVSIGKLL